jgi:sulfite exporter TauE/SafE
MCGPFVLSQVIADVRPVARPYGEWQRLTGAALVPYHLGRLTTYVVLGGLVGAATAVFTATTGFAWVSSAMLVLAATLMVLQALGLALGIPTPMSRLVSNLAAPLVTSRQTPDRYALGLVLGFLPCGLLYGALAAAAAAGSAPAGALAMAAFGLGTLPALVGVGWLGTILRRRLQGFTRWVAAPMLVGNAFAMLMVATQRL